MFNKKNNDKLGWKGQMLDPWTHNAGINNNLINTTESLASRAEVSATFQRRDYVDSARDTEFPSILSYISEPIHSMYLKLST